MMVESHWNNPMLLTSCLDEPHRSGSRLGKGRHIVRPEHNLPRLHAVQHAGVRQ
jgi:hypothetical protein